MRFFIFSSILAFFLLCCQPESATQAAKKLSKAQQNQLKTLTKCIDFADRAVANDTPIIEFQQLLRTAKRANVIERCMSDNGFVQNPAWLVYAKPIAAKNAAKQAISNDEALVNLSRKAMEITDFNDKSVPIYWINKS